MRTLRPLLSLSLALACAFAQLSAPVFAQSKAVTSGPTTKAGAKEIFVSKGSDASDTRTSKSVNDPNAPFATLAAAKAAAVSGDTIVVGPGSYSVTTSLAKTGVNWHFAPGASVARADNTNEALWDDGNTAMTFTVTGDADFTRTRTSGAGFAYVVRIQHASSVIRVKGRDFTADGGTTTQSSVLYQEGGDVEVLGRNALALSTPVTGGGGYCIWWFNGRGIARFSSVIGDYSAYAASVDVTPTGDFHLYAEEILRSVVNFSQEPTAASWIHCNILKDTVPGNGVMTLTGAGKFYVVADKIFGLIFATDYQGLAYITAQKHAQTADGLDELAPFLTLDAGCTGTVFYNVAHQDAVAYSQALSPGAFSVAGGTLNLEAANFTGTSTSKGLLISGGTLNVYPGVNIDTSANSSTSPITKSGGTLTLGAGSTLAAHASAASMTAATAQSVTSRGAGLSTAPHANVAITGPYTVGGALYARAIPRSATTASSATPSIATDTTDHFTITAQAAAITSFTSGLTGTPIEGQRLTIRIRDNGTARAITWGASFASRGATLPTTTTVSKYTYVALIWNATTATWDCISATTEA